MAPLQAPAANEALMGLRGPNAITVRRTVYARSPRSNASTRFARTYLT